eukprot:TRINITY_DN62878_c2_g1_i1.p1 TRINITY_DN62878_c2_g1~~TRINITY_DN62878_c2_g1_i1.p1  ORF type:complete len:435 (+),score=247.76 TRINITY_DN62878_c2_g1_i1:31-1305(+)
MDIRSDVIAVIVGGSPAPGINAVISAAVLEGLASRCRVIGFFDGFKRIAEGRTKDVVHRFDYNEVVTQMYDQGGSFLRTSKMQVRSEQQANNCLRVLQFFRVRYVLTIGGTETAASANRISMLADKLGMRLSFVHVPKTIFNDLPLRKNMKTFGFSTARDVGVRILHNLKSDARTMLRWYVITVMGQKAGHLALAIGKAASATITIIPEEYKDKKLVFSELVDLIEVSIIKRRAMQREHGVVVLTEGLVERMEQKEMEERFGDVDQGHQDLGRHVAAELKERFKKRQQTLCMFTRNLGNELRSAEPNATDITLAKDLGFGAVQSLLAGKTRTMVTLLGGMVEHMPFSELFDPKTGKTQVRPVDTKSMSYEVARKYMYRLNDDDMKNKSFLLKLSQASGLEQADFIKRFGKYAEHRRSGPPTMPL